MKSFSNSKHFGFSAYWLYNLFFSLLIFLAASFYFLWDIGGQSIRYSDEATHVRVTQEMLASDNYLLPTLDGIPYLNKPPLKMWLTLKVINILGESNFSYRLIDGLCSAGIVALVFSLALKIFGSGLVALIAALSLLSSEGFFVTARQNTATQDAFVVFFNTLAIYLGFELLRSRRGVKAVGTAIFFGLSISAGILAKSIVGLVPLLVLVPVLLFAGRRYIEDIQSCLKMYVLAAVTCLIPVVAYFWQLSSKVPGLWDRMFGYDIKQRLFTEGFHNADKWWFYLQRLFVDADFIPAWLLTAALVYQIYLLFLRKKPEDLLIASWAMLPLLVFSALHSRAFHYIAPVFPGMALCIGQLFYSGVLHSRSRIISSLFSVAIVFALLINFSHSSRRLFRGEKKLPIESVLADIKRLPANADYYEYKFADYLAGDAYQRWRQQFYLDIISRKRRIVDKKEDLSSIFSAPGRKFLFSTWQEGMKLFDQPDLSAQICGYWPLWKPSAKRQSVAEAVAEPEAMLIMISDCKGLYDLENFRTQPLKLQFVPGKAKVLFGLETGKRGEIEHVLSHSISISLPKEYLFSGRKLFLSVFAGINPVKDVYETAGLSASLNGVDLGRVDLGGGKIRKYIFNVPAGIWSDSDNILSLHDSVAAREGRASAINLKKIEFSLNQNSVEQKSTN